MARRKNDQKSTDNSHAGVTGALATGVKDLPRNATWLVAKALSPLSSSNGGGNGSNGSSTSTSRMLDSATDAMRSTTALVKDALPGDSDSVEVRIKRAHAAADAAREAEERAVGAT